MRSRYGGKVGYARIAGSLSDFHLSIQGPVRMSDLSLVLLGLRTRSSIRLL